MKEPAGDTVGAGWGEISSPVAGHGLNIQTVLVLAYRSPAGGKCPLAFSKKRTGDDNLRPVPN